MDSIDMKKKTDIKECSCKQCCAACENKPGWFMPGEAEILAKNLDLTLQDLFNKYLAIDWWDGDPFNKKEVNEVFLLSPATIKIKPGGMFGYKPTGQCILYNVETHKCEIHKKGKPYECYMSRHDKINIEVHRSIAKAWATTENQEQLITLLGKIPKII